MIGHRKEIIDYLITTSDEVLFELKEKRSTRSLSQNGYYWSLINQLASKLSISKEELHLKMLRDYGVSEVVSVSEEVGIKDYFEYYDIKGKSELNGKVFTHYKIYKPSHKMNTNEFKVLLDGLIQECEQQHIPTLTPTEIERLKLV